VLLLLLKNGKGRITLSVPIEIASISISASDLLGDILKDNVLITKDYSWKNNTTGLHIEG
jgi:hypothetical protein